MQLGDAYLLALLPRSVLLACGLFLSICVRVTQASYLPLATLALNYHFFVTIQQHLPFFPDPFDILRAPSIFVPAYFAKIRWMTWIRTLWRLSEKSAVGRTFCSS